MNPHSSIKRSGLLAQYQPVSDWYRKLVTSLKRNNQRSLVLLQGKTDWCVHQLPGPEDFENLLVLSNRNDLADVIPFNKAETLLGLETDCLVLDLYSGLNIDVLCMAAGLIRAGGVLILMGPQNPETVDDKYGRWQGSKNKLNYFLKYLFQYFKQSTAVITLQESKPLPAIKPVKHSDMTAIPSRMTLQQAQLLLDMQQWLAENNSSYKNKRCFLLTADRGRGKSTTLGLFARQTTRKLNIVITATSKMQAAVLLKCIDDSADNFQFVAPDELIRRQSRIACLIIDEAAMIPNSLLQQCISLSDKCLLATTTGGYEGTGQGFLLKFIARFNEHDYIHRTLLEPIRWGQQDQLEKLVNDALLFTSKKIQYQTKSPFNLRYVDIRIISKKQLSADMDNLRAIYGLLVSAHYRTRPSDLRQLMDDENQRIIIAKINNEIVAVLLLNLEGGLEEDLCHTIFLGKRRPQGHLFAQMITAQAGSKNFACLSGYRIQRIAVDEHYRQRGIGRLLIHKAELMVIEEKLHYLGSCFALDHTIAPFWKKLGFELIHIGSGKGKSTGRQTVAVIKSSNPAVRSAITPLRNRIHHYLPVWLLGYCKAMLWQDVLALIELHDDRMFQLSALDEDEIMAFTQGYRGFDLTQASLQKLLIRTLSEETKLSNQQIQLLIEKVLLNRTWKNLQGFDGDTGRKEMIRHIRQSVKKCYENYQSTNS